MLFKPKGKYIKVWLAETVTKQLSEKTLLAQATAGATLNLGKK